MNAKRRNQIVDEAVTYYTSTGLNAPINVFTFRTAVHDAIIAAYDAALQDAAHAINGEIGDMKEARFCERKILDLKSK